MQALADAQWLFLKGCAGTFYICFWNLKYTWPAWFFVCEIDIRCGAWKKNSKLTIKIVCTFFYENSKGPADWLLGMYETPSISEVYALSICHEKNTSQRQNLRLHPFSILYPLFSSKVGLLKVPLMLNLGLVWFSFYSSTQLKTRLRLKLTFCLKNILNKVPISENVHFCLFSIIEYRFTIILNLVRSLNMYLMLWLCCISGVFSHNITSAFKKRLSQSPESY